MTPVSPVRLRSASLDTERLIETARQLAKGNDVASASLDHVGDVLSHQAMVVCGETKKGKSSVVNALLRRPGISPVAVDVATATYVAFQHGPNEAWVQQADGEILRVGLDDLADWVSPHGLSTNPAVGTTDSAAPVIAFVDADILRDLVIVDTPGVGGLVGAHLEATLAAIRTAGAMLFVTDITVPLTAPEVSFLRTVSSTANVAEVIIVANKCDRLLEDDARSAATAARERLAAAVPALAGAQLLAVSATRALRAIELGATPAERRERTRRASGFDELEHAIDERIRRRAQVLVEGARLRTVHGAALIVANAARTRIAVLSSDMADDQLIELQDRAIELGHTLETARLAFANELVNLKIALNARLDAGVTDLGTELFLMARSGAPQVDVERVLDQRVAAMAAELSHLCRANIASATRTNFERVATDDDAGELFRSSLVAAGAQAGAESGRQDNRSYQASPMSADVVVTSALGLTSGVAFGGIVGNAVGLGAIANPIGMVLGPAIVIMNLRRQRRTARLTEMREWLRDCVASARRDLSASLNARFEDANYLVGSALKNFHKVHSDRLRSLQRSVAAPARRKQLTAARQQLDAATQLGTATERRLRAIDVPSLVPALETGNA